MTPALCWEKVVLPDWLGTVRYTLRVTGPEEAALVLSSYGVWRIPADGGAVAPAVAPAVTDSGLFDAHPDGVVYVIGRELEGGDKHLWRSADGGASFVRTNGDPADWRDVTDLAVHPGDPDVVLVGGRFSRYLSGYGAALRSSDGGASFRVVGPTFFDGSYAGSAILFAPSRPSRVYLRGPASLLYRSDDGGEDWTLVSDEVAPARLRVHPQDEDWLYGSGLVSRDAGLSWTEATDEDAAAFPNGRDVCPEDGGPCDHWAIHGPFYGWVQYASGDEAWRPAMGGLPYSNAAVYQVRPTWLVSLSEGRAVAVVRTYQAIIF